MVDDANLGETAVQRAFFLQGEIVIDGQERLLLLDLEFPVERDGGGVDLLAGPAPEEPALPTQRCIVELKFRRDKAPPNCCPVETLLQALRYVLTAQQNTPSLQAQPRHDVSRRSVERFPAGWTPAIIVAANRSWWDHWRQTLGTNFSVLRSLADRVSSLGVPCRWLEFPNVEMDPGQPHSCGTYLPRVRHSDCLWMSVY